ncbi:hypothetical protein [Candidatus Poriferisodalis sp.]|uniref:hypothetical protein n=1 Tax=Candidatus Poriferisodalis sp. TaxID=3101277 RepID=UPI003B530155
MRDAPVSSEDSQDRSLSGVAISLLCDVQIGSDHPGTAVDGRMNRHGSSKLRMCPTSVQ